MTARGRVFRRAARAGLGPALAAASRRAILPARGRERVRGIAAPVLVHTDGHGIPHVRARTDADAFFAQGWVHARDRFFQMDMLRRVLRGRLAETVGEKPLPDPGLPPLGLQKTTTDADRLMRALDVVGASRRYLAGAGEEDRHLLDAYVAGVNEALGRQRRHPPLEHRLLRLPLVPWSPVDSLVIAKGMALGLSFKWRTAPVFGAIAARLADRPDLLAALLPASPRADERAMFTVVAEGIGEALAFLPSTTPPAGSNAFVVGRARSRSGAPLLASDPHLELSLPAIWYLASIRGRRFSAVGCSLVGLPGIVIGRTGSLAWGLTNGMIDDADYWEEEVDPVGDRYRVDGTWRPLRVETHEIRRRGKGPVVLRLRRTHRGPLVTDAFAGYEGPPLSLRFSFHEPASDLEAFLSLGRATDGSVATAVAEGFGAPVQNLLWADTRGRAGYTMIGRVPRRPDALGDPVTPLDGRTSATDWLGWVDRARLPSLEIAPDAVLVSANDAHAAGPDAPYLSHLYEPSYRAERLRALLAGRFDLTAADCVRFQMDVEDRAVAWFRERVLLPHAEEVRRTRPILGHAIDRLLAWDGRETPDAPGAALWHLTYHHLLRRVFGGALGERLDGWLGCVNHVDAPLRRAFTDAESPWAPPASRGALLQRALGDAVLDLEARGLDADAPWGRIHRVRLRHPLSAAPVVGAVFDRGPYPAAGGPYTPLSGQYGHPRPADVTSGPSYRQVVDLADGEGRSRMVSFAGQSGHVGSPHYDDLLPLWLAGEGVPMRIETLPRTRDVLWLEP